MEEKVEGWFPGVGVFLIEWKVFVSTVYGILFLASGILEWMGRVIVRGDFGRC